MVAVENLQQLREAVEEQFKCPHPKAHLRVKVASNGARHYRVQCLRCGEGRQATREERARVANPDLFDEGLRDAWYEARNKAYRDASQREREAKKRAWFDQYSEYLRSPEWREKRAARLNADQWQCQARLVGCSGDAEQVHHTTYDHWWDAPLFELVSVCGSCHARITTMDRAR